MEEKVHPFMVGGLPTEAEPVSGSGGGLEDVDETRKHPRWSEVTAQKKENGDDDRRRAKQKRP